uniref:Cycloeucalenol cycloisomerase n=1 Tax=Ananas comosus var. bracteatus TaxID=296719 RepID=A0A6V7NN12_ANACO|nr:unnamed protein product [Ananas comosus var. bracteatus]
MKSTGTNFKYGKVQRLLYISPVDAAPVVWQIPRSFNESQLQGAAALAAVAGGGDAGKDRAEIRFAGWSEIRIAQWQAQFAECGGRWGGAVARRRACGWLRIRARGGGGVLLDLHALLARPVLGIVVPYKLYERFTELEYLILGLVSAVPAILIPLFLVGKVDSGKSLKDRYWVKANLWIIIFSYVGNYFWTHYFFTVLGASYTFPSWRMNNVPHTTFLLTHACFLFYHVASNMTLRRLRHSIAGLPQSIQFFTEAAWILALSYFIAYLETLAIANFPYYEFVDRASMYKVGSLFYAIYFIVSFPMFLRIDEKVGEPWDLPRVAVDALGAAMLVTIILDLWRLFLGPIVPIPESKQCTQPGLAWFQIHDSVMQNESV